MTRILPSHRSWLTRSWQMALQLTVRLSLLSSLLVVMGCEGSSLGENLGNTLEPDPQLAENPNGLTDGAASDGNESAPPEPEPDDDASSASSATAEDAEPTAGSDSNPTPNAATNSEPKVEAGGYDDLGKAPEEIQPYLVDLLALDLLEVRTPAPQPTPAPAADSDSDEGDDDEASTEQARPAPTPPAPNEFRPNQAVTRREYARWLLAVNNRFYEGERDRRVRPGVSSSQPVFKDVPVSDPDFAAIQGLAEAGIIPSPLTGSSTAINFRPDAPLVREDMLLWKVPLDTRQALPEASISAVQQAWGFQDAEKIEPRAQQAVLADYQNGDFANIRRAYSYTTLFQPNKAATRAEAAAVLWRFGNPAEGITAEEIRGN